MPDIKNELKVLYPVLQAYALQPVIMINADTAGTDTVLLFIGKFGRPVPKREQTKLGASYGCNVLRIIAILFFVEYGVQHRAVTSNSFYSISSGYK